MWSCFRSTELNVQLDCSKVLFVCTSLKEKLLHGLVQLLVVSGFIRRSSTGNAEFQLVAEEGLEHSEMRGKS